MMNFIGGGGSVAAMQSATDYKRNEPVTVSVGGLDEDVYVPTGTIQKTLDDMLYPLKRPEFTIFRINGMSEVLELGESFTTGQKLFVWNTSYPQNVLEDSIRIEVELSENNWQTLAENLSNDGQELVNIGELWNFETETTKRFRIVGVNAANAEFSRTLSLAWQGRIYWGTSESTSLTQTDIKALESSILSATRLGQYPFAAGGYKYIAYPATMGEQNPNRMIDPLTNFNAPMVNLGVVNVTNAYGVTIPYRVYRSFNKMGGAVNIAFI
jgi:hypothetical protein